MKIIYPEFRHTDERRTLTQLFTLPITQVNEYEISNGSILGNHYHKETYETFYVTEGSLKVKIDDFSFTVHKGDIFTVEPYEVHTVEAISGRAKMMTFLSKPYSKEDSDIWKK